MKLLEIIHKLYDIAGNYVQAVQHYWERCTRCTLLLKIIHKLNDIAGNDVQDVRYC
jgi:hypothetical protein